MDVFEREGLAKAVSEVEKVPKSGVLLVVGDNHDEKDRRDELDTVPQPDGEYVRGDTDSVTVALGERVRLGSAVSECDANEVIETDTDAVGKGDFVGRLAGLQVSVLRGVSE